MVSDRPCIFHICIPFVRPFLWYQGQGHLSSEGQGEILRS